MDGLNGTVVQCEHFTHANASIFEHKVLDRSLTKTNTAAEKWLAQAGWVIHQKQSEAAGRDGQAHVLIDH